MIKKESSAMNIVFRADANNKIGMGHIMRCLSIADVFKSLGHCVSFVIADSEIHPLVSAKYKTRLLNSDYKDMDSELKSWPEDTDADIIIVDSYFVTKKYLNTLKQKYFLIYIDDILSFPYSADILINYNIYCSNENYKALYKGTNIAIPNLILGPAFTPLRSMFKNIEQKKQSLNVHNVLISTGGADEFHLALTILKILIEGNTNSYIYHILVGKMNPDKALLRTLSEGHDYIILHENVTDMKSLIMECDIAISAAGSTLYEICACGTPVITYSIADNQIPGAKTFEKLGLGINIGDLRKSNSALQNKEKQINLEALNSMFRAIKTLANNYNLRLKMSLQMQKNIDGCGAERIVQKILNTPKGLAKNPIHK